jgi:chromosome partitioning protein
MIYPKNPGKAAHVIVIGNEKGGSGKSTTALHLIIGFLQRGYSVTSIDVDYRQGTLSRYIANRKNFIKAAGGELKMPDHHTISSLNWSKGNDLELEKIIAEKFLLLLEGGLINLRHCCC